MIVSSQPTGRRLAHDSDLPLQPAVCESKKGKISCRSTAQGQNYVTLFHACTYAFVHRCTHTRTEFLRALCLVAFNQPATDSEPPRYALHTGSYHIHTAGHEAAE